MAHFVPHQRSRLVRVFLFHPSWFALYVFLSFWFPFTGNAQTLNENCIVNILNRVVQVDENGSWSLPNIPANIGQIRARATCMEDEQVHVGQSDYFLVESNSVNEVPRILFDTYREPPSSLTVSATSSQLNSVGEESKLTVIASYADGSSEDVTDSQSGINYFSSRPEIATVSANGVVSAITTGNILVTVRKDGVIEFVDRRHFKVMDMAALQEATGDDADGGLII